MNSSSRREGEAANRRRLTRGAFSLAAALLLTLVAAKLSWAASATISAAVDRPEVTVGEAFTYTITVQSQGGQTADPQPPDFTGFIASGSGKSTSISMNGGGVSMSMTSNYQLIPQKEGTFNLGPARVTAGNETVESNTVSVKVVAAGTAAPPQAPPAAGTDPEPQAAPPQAAAGGINPQKLFLYADVNKKEVLVGEPFSYYSALLSEYDLAECGIESEATFTGFVVENLEVKRQLHAVSFKGKHFPLGCEVSKKILIPAAPGTFTIQPEALRTGVKLPVAQQRGRRPRGNWPFGNEPGGDDPFNDPLFDRFFGRNYQLHRELIRAAPVQVKVLPLPDQGKPANFTGIIADGLSILAGLDRKVDQKKVKSGVRETDALNYKVIFSGRGDIRGIPKPELTLGDEFKEYESKATPEVKVDEQGMSGKKTFEFVLVPKRSGHLTIPSVSVSYFDSAERRYKVIHTEPIGIDVAAGEKEERLSAGGTPDRKDVAVLGQDLRFISESPAALVDHGAPLWERGWFRVLNVLPLAGYVFVALAATRRRALARDPVRARRLAAARVAREMLRGARQDLSAKKPKEIYGQLEEALLEYLWGKLGVPANSFVVETSDSFLRERGVSAELAGRVRELLTRFDRSRYAPGAGEAGELERDADATEALLGDLESAL